jgi:two-component system sensor histidine kinase RpfC
MLSTFSALAHGLRGTIAGLSGRPDTEHEQAIVRMIVGALIVLYSIPGAAVSHEPTIWVMLGYLGVSVLIFLHVLAVRAVSPLRRVLGALADIATLTWVMSFLGERAAALFLVYVWVTLANGFRFGARYLLISLALSVAGFVIVMATSEFWAAHWSVGVGLLIGFIALSLYVRSLVTKLFDALAHAAAANLAKRRFISVVSHEMRTPLNAIIGMADLLRDTTLSREQADMLQTLRGSARVMLGLVEDVLDFSKIEAGKLSLDHSDFDLHALINSTCRILSAQAALKGVEFVVSIMPEVVPNVRGDPHHLRQVLINLAGNAVKFTERGSVTVHVSAQGETSDSVRLKFSIRDTGVGISPEAQQKIFESFTQADQSTTRRFGGTGLGTTIAKQLVALMGGRLGLESAVGLGSTFWFEIELNKQPERSGIAKGELSAARVMLVGFPFAEATKLEESLAAWGGEVVVVESVEDASAKLVSEISLAKPYHSVIVYSGSSELGQISRLKRLAPQPLVPTILAAPQQAAIPRFEALSAGYAGVLELPYEKRQLFNILHSVSAVEEIRDGVVRLQDYRRVVGQRKLSVLVADDNATNREVIGKILERGGHSVTLVLDGEQALDAMEQDKYDIILLDRNMPGMGGVEVLKTIRLMTRGGERVPIAILSADVTSEVRRECLAEGADSFLSKPVEAVRLLNEVQVLAGRATDTKRVRQGQSLVERTSDAPEIVNRETLRHLEELGSSHGFLEKLVSVFLTDNESLVARMESALAARNYGEWRSLLHAMKGSAASMGTDRLTRVCGELGKLTDSELRLKSATLTRTVGDELAEVRQELEKYLSDRRQSSGV